jgi:Mycobacterium membrane protein
VTHTPNTPTPPAPPRKSRTGRIILIVIVALVVLCGGGIAIVAALSGGGSPAGTSHTIVFEVAGPAAADITYGVGTDQSQDNGASLPWRKEVTSKDDALLITVLLAQSKSTGDITCKITVDGKVVKENKSSGEFAVVTCSS